MPETWFCWSGRDSLGEHLRKGILGDPFPRFSISAQHVTSKCLGQRVLARRARLNSSVSSARSAWQVIAGSEDDLLQPESQMAIGHNLWLHFRVHEYSFATYFDVQGYGILTHRQMTF